MSPVRRSIVAGAIAVAAVAIVAMRRGALDFRDAAHPLGPEGVSFPPVRETPVVLQTRVLGGRLAEETAQVRRALERLYPEDSLRSWSSRVHALSLWGQRAAPPCAYCEKAMAVISDTDQAASVYPHERIYRATRFGIRLVGNAGGMAEFGDAHPDYTLAVLARLGFDSRHKILVHGTPYTIADMVRASCAEFLPDNELEWTAIAYALYLPPGTHWTNKYGESYDFDGLCDRLCRAPTTNQACYGTHAFQALAILCRVDAKHAILGEVSRRAAHDRILDAIQKLRDTQQSNGCWDLRWYGTDDWLKGEPTASPEMVVTGHMLEFLAWAPDSVPVDGSMIERACRFVVERLLAESDATIFSQYGTFAHCGAALRSWYPEAWRQARSGLKTRRGESKRS
ncbi:MAG: hypothetical protein NUV77_07805 [Thermoguttaceae bacterium]|jgi:hypothetical protein|nr:hypothetical protein [Thermoguttaceae bacterium]